MSCAACGHETPPGAAFCGACGAPLAAACASCGSENPAGARFCNRCGAGLAGPAAPASLPLAAAREPRAYTPNHLRDRILASRSALEGERKQVTVLFVDVRGSMELSGAVDAEEWHGVLDRLFQILADGVHRFEGTINQYTGDGVMALFGAPIAHEDHAQRACFAVLHLRDTLRAYTEEIRLSRGLDLSVRMGLHSGQVVVGKIGDDLRMDYTAQGQVVGLAARLQEVAGADRACVSEATANLVRGYFGLRDLGEARLKGVPEPVRVFELEGRGELRTRFDLSRARGLSKFVGRARESAVLEAALERALAGNGQVVGVVAEAGTGKSRLCFELLERCRARGLLVRTAAGVAHGRAVPLLPVLEFYRESFGIEERDDARTARQKIAGSVVRLDESLLPSLPLLDDFLGVSDPEKSAALPEGPERQRALLSLLKRMTLARSRREPAVLLFEDLHWIDPATEAFVETLADAVDGSRTLLVVNFRPEYRSGWMGRSYYQQIALAPLDEAAFAELLADLLGRDASLAGLAGQIHARSGGNPFFAEELVRELIESGALEGSHGAYRLTRELPALALPATVQAVLAARIDRLPEREKGLLQTASVIGEEFAEPLLARVAGLAPEPLAESLRALVRAELLVEAALYPEAEYAFRHPLTQEVAYGSQLRERRARVHEAVAKALVELHPGRLDELAALLAHHFEGAGDLGEAAGWHRRAGLWLEGRDPATARGHFERVLEIVGPRPESREAARTALQAAARLLQVSVALGLDPARGRDLYREGRAMAPLADDRGLEATLLASYARFANFAGDPALGMEVASEALGLAEHVTDPGLYGEFILATGGAHMFQGSPAEGILVADRVFAARAASFGADPRLLARHHAMRGRMLLELGRIAEAAEEFEFAATQARRVQDLNLSLWLEGFRSVTLPHFRGDVGAIESVARRVARADELSASFWRVQNRGALAGLLLLANRVDEALATAEEAIAIARETGASLSALFSLEAQRVRALLGKGEVGRAAEAAASIGSASSFLAETRLRLLRAELAIATDPEGERERIEALLHGVDAEAAARGIVHVTREVHELRAALHAALGDEAGRARELGEAHRLCVEIGATGHAERLARELAA